MATVTGITDAEAEAISNNTIVDVTLDDDYHLVMLKKGGTELDIGRVADSVPKLLPSLATLSAFDKDSQDVLIPDWYVPGILNSKIAFTSTIDTVDWPRGISWSNDGVYVAFGTSSSPYVNVWKKATTGLDEWTVLSSFSELSLSASNGSRFSPDGQYLAFVTESAPYIMIYKRSGDTFTKLPDPVDLPLASARFVSWSPDGTYLVVSYTTTSPYLVIYKRSGDTFAKLPDPAVVPPDAAQGTAFSPDGRYLVVTHLTSPYLLIYRRDGDIFTKLSNPASLPTGNPTSARWSANGQYLVVVHASSPYVTIYKRSVDVFTKLANPDVLPAGTSYGAAWSPDMQYLSLVHANTPYGITYKRSGDTFNKIESLGVVSYPPPSMSPTPGLFVSPLPSAGYIDVPAPSGVVLNSVVLAHIYIETQAPITPPADWFLAGYSEVDFGGASIKWRIYAYWHRATGPETGPYRFTFTPVGGTLMGYSVRLDNCVRTGSPIDVVASGSTLATTFLSPSVSVITGQDNELLVHLTGDFQESPWTPPFGFTEVHDNNGLATSYKLQETAGSTGSIQATNTQNNSGKASMLLAVKGTVASATAVGTSPPSCAWSPDGKYLAMSQQLGGSMSIYKSNLGLITGEPVKATPTP